MAFNYKVIGQIKPAIGGALEQLCVVGASKSVVGSSLVVCNRGAFDTFAKISVAVVPSGETLADKHYIHTDVPIKGTNTRKFMDGITLAAGDKVMVGSSTGTVSFSFFGSENS